MKKKKRLKIGEVNMNISLSTHCDSCEREFRYGEYEWQDDGTCLCVNCIEMREDNLEWCEEQSNC